MAERDLTNGGPRVALSLSVLTLLACGVVDVLLAVTESVLWPLVVGVGWTVVAGVVVVYVDAATPSRSRARPVEPGPMAAATPARRG